MIKSYNFFIIIFDLECVIVSACDDKELYNLMKEKEELAG